MAIVPDIPVIDQHTGRPVFRKRQPGEAEFEDVSLWTVPDELRGLYKLAAENADLRETAAKALALALEAVSGRGVRLTFRQHITGKILDLEDRLRNR